MRNTLALRRLSPDAPALGSEEKLRFLRSWLLCLATALASVFEPLGREDAHPRVWQLMLDRLAQPQFWNAALTIATRQHAQLLQMHDTLEELETGTESLATGEQVAQWFGRSGPGDWPLRRLKVHIPVAAMAYRHHCLGQWRRSGAQRYDPGLQEHAVCHGRRTESGLHTAYLPGCGAPPPPSSATA